MPQQQYSSAAQTQLPASEKVPPKDSKPEIELTDAFLSSYKPALVFKNFVSILRLLTV